MPGKNGTHATSDRIGRYGSSYTSFMLGLLAFGPISIGALGIAHAQSDTLLENHPLRDGDYLRSNNGVFIAVMQHDGNFVVYRGTKPGDQHGHLWDHGHLTSCPCFAVVQGDGNFVVYHGADQAHPGGVVWASNKYSNGDTSPYVGILQDDGNFVIYHGRSENDRGAAFWDTGKLDPLQGFDNMTAFNYDLKSAKLDSVTLKSIATQHVDNKTDSVQSSTISRSDTTTAESNWSDSYTQSHGFQAGISVEIPIVSGSKATPSFTYTSQSQSTQTNGGSSSWSEQWQYSIPISLPPHTSGDVVAQVQEGKIRVPYTLSGVAHFQSGTVMPIALSGVYMGVNSFDLEVVLTQAGSTGGNVPLRRTLLTQKTPKTPPVVMPPPLTLRTPQEPATMEIHRSQPSLHLEHSTQR